MTIEELCSLASSKGYQVLYFNSTATCQKWSPIAPEAENIGAIFMRRLPMVTPPEFPVDPNGAGPPPST